MWWQGSSQLRVEADFSRSSSYILMMYILLDDEDLETSAKAGAAYAVPELGLQGLVIFTTQHTLCFFSFSFFFFSRLDV